MVKVITPENAVVGVDWGVATRGHTVTLYHWLLPCNRVLHIVIPNQYRKLTHDKTVRIVTKERDT